MRNQVFLFGLSLVAFLGLVAEGNVQDSRDYCKSEYGRAVGAQLYFCVAKNVPFVDKSEKVGEANVVTEATACVALPQNQGGSVHPFIHFAYHYRNQAGNLSGNYGYHLGLFKTKKVSKNEVYVRDGVDSRLSTHVDDSLDLRSDSLKAIYVQRITETGKRWVWRGFTGGLWRRQTYREVVSSREFQMDCERP